MRGENWRKRFLGWLLNDAQSHVYPINLTGVRHFQNRPFLHRPPIKVSFSAFVRRCRVLFCDPDSSSPGCASPSIFPSFQCNRIGAWRTIVRLSHQGFHLFLASDSVPNDWGPRVRKRRHRKIAGTSRMVVSNALPLAAVMRSLPMAHGTSISQLLPAVAQHRAVRRDADCSTNFTS